MITHLIIIIIIGVTVLLYYCCCGVLFIVCVDVKSETKMRKVKINESDFCLIV
jgi:hypothetical protein